MVVNRLDYVMDHSASGQGGWSDRDHHPSDVLRRNFWFGTIDVTSSMVLRDHIGVDHIVLESDYPHADSTWPDTQARAARGLAGLPDDVVQRVTWQNASALLRHEVRGGTRRPADAIDEWSAVTRA